MTTQTQHDRDCRIGWPCKYGLGDPCPVTMTQTKTGHRRCGYCRRPVLWHDEQETAECAGFVEATYAGWMIRYRRDDGNTWVWFACDPEGGSAVGSGDRAYASLDRAKSRAVACIDRLLEGRSNG